MTRVMVRYTVKPDRVAENEQLVRDVYAELARTQPDGLRYATFKLPDGVSFVHLAVHGQDNPLQRVEAFGVSSKAFAIASTSSPSSPTSKRSVLID
jgi:hypothetical protein